MKFNEYEATIAQHFVCAIEYGDMSGLTDKEERQVARWLKDYPSACFEYGKESSFDHCEICGMRAGCIEVKIFVPVAA